MPAAGASNRSVLSGAGRSLTPMLAPERCPSCKSLLLQPLRWEQLPNGDLDVRLRCPDCETCCRMTLAPAAMRDLDLRQTAERERLKAAYANSVSESMEALASSLTAAFARDLITADDFAPRHA